MKKAQYRGKRHAYEQFQLKQFQRAWVHYTTTDLHAEMLEVRRRSVPHISSSVTISSLAKKTVERLEQTK